MNIRLFEQFLALSHSLHFGRASEICNISVSALSRNIRLLERELGVALFNRDNRSVELSAPGKQFETYARDAVTNWNKIRHELQNTGGALKGEVSLYCSVTASHSILFDLLNQFRRAHPGIEIKLHTGDPEHAIAHIVSGEEDISIAARPAKLSSTLAFKPITVSPLLFIAPLNAGYADIPEQAPSDNTQWSTIPMILSEGGIARSRVDSWFKSMRVTPRIYAQVAGNEAIVSMVSLGLGVGVVPKLVLDHSLLAERVRVLDIAPALEPYDVGLFALKKNLHNPLVDAFWSVL